MEEEEDVQGNNLRDGYIAWLLEKRWAKVLGR
jgi:hypothetical protein